MIIADSWQYLCNSPADERWVKKGYHHRSIIGHYTHPQNPTALVDFEFLIHRGTLKKSARHHIPYHGPRMILLQFYFNSFREGQGIGGDEQMFRVCGIPQYLGPRYWTHLQIETFEDGRHIATDKTPDIDWLEILSVTAAIRKTMPPEAVVDWLRSVVPAVNDYMERPRLPTSGIQKAASS